MACNPALSQRCPGTVPARLVRIWRLGMAGVKGKKHSDEAKLKMCAAKEKVHQRIPSTDRLWEVLGEGKGKGKRKGKGNVVMQRARARARARARGEG